MRKKLQFMGILLVIVVGLLVLLYAYGIPRWRGDQFMRRLANLELEQAQALVCEGTNLRQTVASWNEGITRLDDALSSIVSSPVILPGLERLASTLEVESRRYNPLTGRYSATLRVGGDVTVGGMTFSSDVRSSPVQLRILHEGLIGACVMPA